MLCICLKAYFYDMYNGNFESNVLIVFKQLFPYMYIYFVTEFHYKS